MTEPRSNRIHPLAAGAAIVVLTTVAYIPAMRAGYVWDDSYHLHENVVLTEGGLYKAWFTTEPFVYYPVTWTSLRIEHQLWGLHPTGYHVVNVLLHALSAVIIWRILLRLKLPGAWIAAMLFALHPVNVESVAWITQRKNTMAMVGFALSLWCYLRFDDTGTRRAYVGSIVAFILAMLSKGAVVTMPAALGVILWWRHGSVRRIDVIRSLPFFAVSIVMSFVEVWFQGENVIADDVVYDAGMIERTAAAAWSAGFYLYKAVLPWRLCFVYPRWDVDVLTWWTWLPLLAWIGGLIWLCRRRRNAFAATLFFAVMVFPALGFAHFYYLRYSLVADHYQYFALIGVAALIGVWFTKWPGGRAVAVLVLAGFMALTWRQSSLYADQETLWRDTLRKNPDAWLAHNNLGNLLEPQGHFAEAIYHHRETLRLNPDLPLAHNSLGHALLGAGRVDEAIDHLRDALAIDDRYKDAWNNLGVAHTRRGRFDEARRCFKRAIAIKQDFADAHDNLAVTLRQLGELDQAQHHHREALRLNPESAAVHHNLAVTLLRLERPREAILLAGRAVRWTEGGDPRMLAVLADAFAAAGQVDRAIETAERIGHLAQAAGSRRGAERARTMIQAYRLQRRP